MAQRTPARAQQSAPAEVLASLNLGYNGYTDPTLTNPRQWVAGNNAFSGAFGYVQRARFANVVTPGPAAIAIQANPVGASYVTGTATINTITPHGFSVGQRVNITGVLDSGLNINGFDGAFVIVSVPTSTSFTYALNNGTIAQTGGGGIAYVAFPAQGTVFTTLKFFALPGTSNYLLGDSNGKLFSFDSNNSYLPTIRLNPYVDPYGVGSSSLAGPWSRDVLQNIVYEMNGQVKQAGRGSNAAIVEGMGINAPDVSPQVVISAGTSQSITNIQRSNGTVTATLGGALTVPGGNGIGMVNVVVTSGDTSFAGTFVVLTGSGTATLTWTQSGQNTAVVTPTGTVNTNITKSIGRSYAYAWENANKSHVSAPSPVSQFIQYASQNGVIQCIEQGTVSTSGTIVTGTGTAFSQAWVGQYIWIAGGSGLAVKQIVSVQSATQLTLGLPIATVSNQVFQIFDPQATHIRLYATADGGATYLRIQRNAFTPNFATTIIGAGLQFNDNAQAEPPNFPFTTEVSQLFNVPPPVGAFLKEYQGRLLAFGGTIPGQTFFYTNVESTTVGLPQESCAPLNQVTLPIQNANISGMADFPGSLIIWSDKQDMFRLTGLLSDNTPLGLGATNTAAGLGTQISALPYNLGCANPFAVAITPLGAIWVTSNRELWLFTDKYAPRNIGRPIQNVLRNILPSQMASIRLTYYHSLDRNWVAIAFPNGTSNNTLALLDLDLLASNGQPSFFTFDMATNHPAFWLYSVNCTALETMYEAGGSVRLFVGSTDLVQDVDYQTGLFGTEIPVAGGSVTTHAWGNDSAFILKRPNWVRFNTNRDPSLLASDGWSFAVNGIDDDFYSFASPLTLNLTPGVNDTSSLSGNPNLSSGAPFRHSPELFRIGGVNFVMGRRLTFTVNFPPGVGVNYALRSIQIGFGASPPR